MAFSIQTFRRALYSSSFSTTRGFCVPSSISHLKQFESYLHDLKNALSPSVVPLKTFFVSPAGDRRTFLRANGVFLEPNLIATSARAVGRLITFYEPRTAEKPDRFEHGCISHKSDIGSTVALTVDGKVLETKPLAVNFSDDLAVLKVVKPEGEFSPRCALASSVPLKDDILMAISHLDSSGSVIMLGNVRSTEERTFRAKAPWPLEDRSEWLEHNWFGVGGGKPPPPFKCRDKLTGSITKVTGSPWFNIYSEVVGIASWEVLDGPSRFSIGFAVPSSLIGTVLEYAKIKGPEDPVVMDPWVARVGSG